jgi:6-phosphogluconolactonase
MRRPIEPYCRVPIVVREADPRAAEVADRLVVPVRHSPKPPRDRISLTLAALAGTERLLVLAAGAAKADPVARARAGDDRLPLTRAVEAVRAAGGSVAWLLDRAAAA